LCKWCIMVQIKAEIKHGKLCPPDMLYCHPDTCETCHYEYLQRKGNSC
jgi:hypothetical protein